ncbi:major facilitator superfamily domain-containing protein [Aspergillus fruticulosus]
MPIITNTAKATKTPAPFSHPQGPCYDPETIVLTWDGPNDPANPVNWPTWKKWAVTGIGLFATFLALMNGTIITTAHYAIDREFGTLLLASYFMGHFGIRYVFLAVYFIYICFLIPMGVAQNFETIIITRFFSGGCVAILANTVAGIICNIFVGNRARTVPMSTYITVYLVSSSMGPVICASIFQFLSWR